MAVSRRWAMESKEFKVLIKGGVSRARIFEESIRNRGPFSCKRMS
jgi:hypothetical protein